MIPRQIPQPILDILTVAAIAGIPEGRFYRTVTGPYSVLLGRGKHGVVCCLIATEDGRQVRVRYVSHAGCGCDMETIIGVIMEEIRQPKGDMDIKYVQREDFDRIWPFAEMLLRRDGMIRWE